jgi:hypothetical protein
MNERIKQILLQVVPMAGEDGEYLPSLHTPEDIERFGELIVRECAKVCNDIDAEYDGEDVLATWCAAEIKKHFGVSE